MSNTPNRAAIEAAVNKETAITNAIRLGLLGLGLGAGARGFQGLVNLGKRNLRPPTQQTMGTHTIDIPLGMPQEEEEDQFKFGEDRGMLQTYISDPIAKAFRGETSRPGNWPLAMPAALLGMGGGMYGGYKLTDMLLDKRRKTEIDNELEEAKKRYEAALSGKSVLGEALDQLCDLLEKKGGLEDVWGGGIGAALTAGIPMALLSGVVAYDLTKKRQPTDVLRKAKLKRLRELNQRQPPALYARPQYDAGSTEVPTEDEMAGEPLDKAARWPYTHGDPLSSSRGHYAVQRRRSQPIRDAYAAQRQRRADTASSGLEAKGYIKTDKGWEKQQPRHTTAQGFSVLPPGLAGGMKPTQPGMTGPSGAQGQPAGRGYTTIPRAFQQRYQQMRAQGRTTMSPQQAADYYYKHYHGSGKGLPQLQQGTTQQAQPTTPTATQTTPTAPTAPTPDAPRPAAPPTAPAPNQRQPAAPQQPQPPQQAAAPAPPRAPQPAAQPQPAARPQVGRTMPTSSMRGPGTPTAAKPVSPTIKPQASPVMKQPAMGAVGGPMKAPKMPKLGHDAPGNASPAIPVQQPGTVPPYGGSGPSNGGATEGSQNPVPPGSTSNHPAPRRKGLLI